MPTGAAVLSPMGFNSVFAGVGVGFVSVAYPSMMADAADEHEHLFGARRDGLYFSGLGFAAKAAGGLGVLVGGFALDLIGFPHDAGHPGVVLSAAVLDGLILAWGPGAALVAAAGILVFAPYAITRERHDVIAAELRARRAVSVAP